MVPAIYIENERSRQKNIDSLNLQSSGSNKGAIGNTNKSYSYAKKLATTSFNKIKGTTNFSAEKQSKPTQKSRLASSQEKIHPSLKDTPVICPSGKISKMWLFYFDI